MITDVQLAIFSNVLGVFLFLLVVAYHYINANTGKYVLVEKIGPYNNNSFYSRFSGPASRQNNHHVSAS